MAALRGIAVGPAPAALCLPACAAATALPLLQAELPISTPILLPPHKCRWPCARRCWRQAAAQPCTQKWSSRHAPQATASSWTGKCGCIGCHNGRLKAALPLLHDVLACCAAFVSMMAAVLPAYLCPPTGWSCATSTSCSTGSDQTWPHNWRSLSGGCRPLWLQRSWTALTGAGACCTMALSCTAAAALRLAHPAAAQCENLLRSAALARNTALTCPICVLCHSLLAMLIKGEPWSPGDHQHYPPAFRAAVRTLLLAHRRSGSAAVTQRATRSGAGRAAVEGQVGAGDWCRLALHSGPPGPVCKPRFVRHTLLPCAMVRTTSRPTQPASTSSQLSAPA